MALNMDAIGKTIGPLTRDYTWKDVVLYALGVGAGFADLEYCYEKDLKVIPSFAIAAIFDLVFHHGFYVLSDRQGTIRNRYYKNIFR